MYLIKCQFSRCRQSSLLNGGFSSLILWALPFLHSDKAACYSLCAILISKCLSFFHSQFLVWAFDKILLGSWTCSIVQGVVMFLTFLWVLSDADSECVFLEYYLVVNRYSEIVFLLAELRALPEYSRLRTYLAVGTP